MDDRTRTLDDTVDQIPPVQRVQAPPQGPSFLPPLWAVGLMLLCVVGVSGGIVAVVLFLGGNTAEPGEVDFVIVTAPPTAFAPPADAAPAIQVQGGPTPTLLPDFAGEQRGAAPSFVLEGPTLAPVFLSPTPAIIAVGSQVQVVDVGANGLNIRNNPGLGGTLLFAAPEGTVYEVIEGPTLAGGLTWWRLRDPFSREIVGWGAASYLEVNPGP